MKEKGKSYACRKPESKRPKDDFYQTPKCMTWELLNTGLLQNYLNETEKKILDPCCGKYAISKILKNNGFTVFERDLMYGNDFLNDNYDGTDFDAIVMNPPFKHFDSFVKKAKGISPVVCCIGKLNFFGAHDRNISGLWDNLEWVLPFDRQIAYDSPFREDGKVNVGMMISGWFIWNKNYNAEPKIKVIDMQKYILKAEEKNAYSNSSNNHRG